MVINITAANKANEITHARVLLLKKKFTNAKMRHPDIKPIPNIAKGDKLPLVNMAIKLINRKMPEVMPKAISNILQSTTIVKLDNKAPITTQYKIAGNKMECLDAKALKLMIKDKIIRTIALEIINPKYALDKVSPLAPLFKAVTKIYPIPKATAVVIAKPMNI